MKKLLLLIFLFTLFFIPIASAYQIYFLYKSLYFYVSPIDTRDIPIDSFNALKEFERAQIHRLLLDSLEKSRLASLFYVGDKYEFNQVEIELIYTDLFKIKDKSNNLEVELFYSL